MIFMATIKEDVAHAFGLTTHDIIGDSRVRYVAWARQLAMALCCEFTCQSLIQIGRAFGDRDHSTVFHARERMKQRVQAPKTEQEIEFGWAYLRLARKYKDYLRRKPFHDAWMQGVERAA